MVGKGPLVLLGVGGQSSPQEGALGGQTVCEGRSEVACQASCEGAYTSADKVTTDKSLIS